MSELQTNWIRMEQDKLTGQISMRGRLFGLRGANHSRAGSALFDLYAADEGDEAIGAVWEWPKGGGEVRFSMVLATGDERLFARLVPMSGNGEIQEFRIVPHQPVGSG